MASWKGIQVKIMYISDEQTGFWIYIWDYTTQIIDDCIKPKSNEDFMECLVGFCMF